MINLFQKSEGHLLLVEFWVKLLVVSSSSSPEVWNAYFQITKNCRSATSLHFFGNALM